MLRGLAVGLTVYGALALCFVCTLPFRFRSSWVKAFVVGVSRRVVPFAFRAGGVRLRCAGLAQLAAITGPRILVVNHASNLDTMVMYVALGSWDLAFVAKAEIFRNPLVGGVARAVGWFGVERHSPLSMKRFHEDVKKRAQTGWIPQLVIFPEGTRTRDGKLLPLQLGTFVLAAQLRSPIVPIVIRGTYRLHPRKAFSVLSGPVMVEIKKPIYPPPGPITATNIGAVALALQAQTEAVYRAYPDLSIADDE